jgi:hypothetical protein
MSNIIFWLQVGSRYSIIQRLSITSLSIYVSIFSPVAPHWSVGHP